MATKQLTQKAATQSRMAERDWVTVYLVDDVTLVPHYTKEGFWVHPSGESYEPQALEDVGARRSTTLLWPRYWLQEQANGTNP
jgi:hypothetical protein